MQTVIFDGIKMDVIKYDKSLGTVELPVVFGGENGRWCPLTKEFGPVVSIMVGEVIDMEDDISATGLFVLATMWLSMIIFCCAWAEFAG